MGERVAAMFLTTRDIAYLLGAVGLQLRRTDIIARDRDAMTGLRDRLLEHISVAPDVSIALGVGEGGRIQ